MGLNSIVEEQSRLVTRATRARSDAQAQTSTSPWLVATLLVSCAGAVVLDSPLAIARDALPARTATSDLAQVTVVIEGFRNDHGDALLALFRNAEQFPTAPEQAELRQVARIENGRARLTLSGVKPGTLALSVLHDEDGDKKLKTGIFGIPREGIGFSRDARGRFGPPKFADARLSVAPGDNLTVSIHMHYY